ncbi:MAG: hypothetical protein ABIF82_07940 [Planctomycetota bacterium]
MNIKWKGTSKMKTVLILPVIGVASVFLFFGELCFACASGIVKLCCLEKAGVADEQVDESRPSASCEPAGEQLDETRASVSCEHAGAGSRGRE